uniref:Tubulin-specific chaperone A n=2 Tax=Caenorhabditis japonica TaxID=281687 RepID=A0A8R1E4H4_CAEJA
MNIMSDAEQVKQLKIKTGVVKRLVKEHISYQKQVVKDEEKAAKLAADATNEDEEYVAKKAKEVARETVTMVRDAQGRLQKAVADLQNLIASGNFSESAELSEAKTQLEAATASA